MKNKKGMHTSTLLSMGFKMKKITKNPKDGYWYELNYREHRFITNDNFHTDNGLRWFVGYENKKLGNGDVEFFDGKMNSPVHFKNFFEMVTGSKFNLTITPNI